MMRYEKEGKFKVLRFLEAEKAKQEEWTKKIAEVILQRGFLHEDTDKARFYKKYFKDSWELAELR